MATTCSLVVPGRGTVASVLATISALSVEVDGLDGDHCVRLTVRLHNLANELVAREKHTHCLATPETLDFFIQLLRRTLTFVSYCRSTTHQDRFTTYVQGELRLLHAQVDRIEAGLFAESAKIVVVREVPKGSEYDGDLGVWSAVPVASRVKDV